MRDIKFIVLHCSAGPQDQSTTDIKAYWAHKLGWKSYGYHYLINKNGSVEQLTDVSKPTNGVKGYNANSIHVCYKGGQGGVDNRTFEQKATMLRLVTTLKKQFPKAVICGHRDFSPDSNGDGKITSIDWLKTCPNFNAIEEFKHIKP
jgi:N-acetylmuramoyl-L-alanine amidase